MKKPDYKNNNYYERKAATKAKQAAKQASIAANQDYYQLIDYVNLYSSAPDPFFDAYKEVERQRAERLAAIQPYLDALNAATPWVKWKIEELGNFRSTLVAYNPIRPGCPFDARFFYSEYSPEMLASEIKDSRSSPDFNKLRDAYYAEKEREELSSFLGGATSINARAGAL